jgi:hypothetical protein
MSETNWINVWTKPGGEISSLSAFDKAVLVCIAILLLPVAVIVGAAILIIVILSSLWDAVSMGHW